MTATSTPSLLPPEPAPPQAPTPTPSTALPDAAPVTDAPRDAAPALCPPLFEIPFALKETTLDKRYDTQLQDLVTWLHDHPEADLTVTGHSDATGSEYQNFSLSRRRARAVVNRLQRLGLAPHVVRLQALGEYAPKAGLAPKDPGNRRVSLEIDLNGHRFNSTHPCRP